ncbi:hypothetical protein L1987_54859 [Smallanthus sonchifolius]|uniref:Uncharacterized protein n=1 Tax=Smallanthus sonchifolius TaxID=185202 RepID=A0ACB9E9C8_9ASTR|nr:hypothetical protein L1987_54859 [Smallanthus sonchifolius]
MIRQQSIIMILVNIAKEQQVNFFIGLGIKILAAESQVIFKVNCWSKVVWPKICIFQGSISGQRSIIRSSAVKVGKDPTVLSAREGLATQVCRWLMIGIKQEAVAVYSYGWEVN